MFCVPWYKKDLCVIFIRALVIKANGIYLDLNPTPGTKYRVSSLFYQVFRLVPVIFENFVSAPKR